MNYVRKTQEGAHGYWCKSIEARETKEREEAKAAQIQIREANEWEQRYKKRNSLEDMTLEEFLDWNEGYEDDYGNESLQDPLIDTATKELPQEVQDIKTKSAYVDATDINDVGDGQAISYMGPNGPNYPYTRYENRNPLLVEQPLDQRSLADTDHYAEYQTKHHHCSEHECNENDTSHYDT